jgi:hypothetical protein
MKEGKKKGQRIVVVGKEERKDGRSERRKK